jgi:hypothetical protein
LKFFCSLNKPRKIVCSSINIWSARWAQGQSNLMDAVQFHLTMGVGEREYINLGVLSFTVELHGAID